MIPFTKPQKKSVDFLLNKMTLINTKKQKVYIEGISASYLAKNFKTPFYCYSLNQLIKNITPNKKRMLAVSNEGYTTATDFADYLVQNKDLSFREAYKISARLVNYAENKNKKLHELNLNEVRKVKSDLSKNVMKVFDVKNSVNSKSSYGGTSIKNIKKMILKLKREFK